MSMILELRQIEASAIDSLLSDPDQIEELLDLDDAIYDSGVPQENIAPEIDLDKSWHAIHFLLTGSAWGGEPPFSYLLVGGEEVGDVDVGYGPARVLRPQEVSEFDMALASVSPEDLRNRFDPQAIAREEIYAIDPQRREEELEYIFYYYDILRTFVHDASLAGKGLLIYMT